MSVEDGSEAPPVTGSLSVTSFHFKLVLFGVLTLQCLHVRLNALHPNQCISSFHRICPALQFTMYKQAPQDNERVSSSACSKSTGPSSSHFWLLCFDERFDKAHQPIDGTSWRPDATIQPIKVCLGFAGGLHK